MSVLQQIFDTFGVTWPKFLAQVILFLIVYVVLSKYAFGPIVKMLEERRRLIEEGQNNAEKIKQQLAESEKRYEEVLQRANAEAQALIEEARKSGEALTEKQAQDAIRRAEDIIAKARLDIDSERHRMIGEVKREMVNLVIDTTAKVTGKILTPEDQARLTQETTSQIAA